MGDPSSISGSPLRNSAARWGATSLRSSADLPRTYSPKTDIPKILTNSFEDVPKGRKLSSLVHAAKKISVEGQHHDTPNAGVFIGGSSRNLKEYPKEITFDPAQPQEAVLSFPFLRIEEGITNKEEKKLVGYYCQSQTIQGKEEPITPRRKHK